MTTDILSTLRNIIQDVNDASGLEQALNITVKRIKQVMQVDAVSVYFRDNTLQQLILMATDGLNQNAIGKIRFNLDQGLIGLVLKQAEPINIEDAHEHPDYHFVTETDEISFHGFLGVPIIQHRQVLGILVVRQTRRRRFSANDETYLVTLAAQLAGAISHAKKMGELTSLLKNIDGQSFHLSGISGSSGVAIGEAHVVYPPASLSAVPDKQIAPAEVDEQIREFTNALSSVEKEFKDLSQRMAGVLSKEDIALFDVFALMLRSDTLTEAVIARIKAGQWAQGALRETITEHVKKFTDMEDAYFRERAVDIKDLGLRILMHLQKSQREIKQVKGPVIMVAEEITVSHFAEVPLEYLMAVISSKGSASSHVSILANALGLPSVVGVDDLPVSRIQGQQLIVDGYQGQVYVKPSAALLEEFYRLMDADKIHNSELSELVDKPSETLDGVHIALHVNTGLLEDISPSLKSGAEGVGLYRTEIPFLIRDGFPGEDEQAKTYRQILKSFSPRPVTFRTLDIGGDKALPYFPIEEENPFLGWRGIRIMLDHPELFLTQIRAILKSNVYQNNLRLMLPMVSDVAEVDEAVALIRRAHQELNDEGLSLPFPVLGLMIEVPSAVYQMRALAKRVDFFSIGSNDLTQYLLAVDRNNKQVAALYNSMHPAVLHAIREVVNSAHLYNKPVSVCGEMAGDPASALALVGMGVDSLSMSAGSVLKVKMAIRLFTKADTEALLKEALAMENVADIRLLFDRALEQVGASSLIKKKSQ
ncbi:MAG: phosphoenolpyruvate--protein phosphotransferase [Gammaproteobacteria bacterium]|nr:phosphoenolpyruvate--protein phosphotransferase [Gammaproteobacteria bacterium]